MHFSEVIKQQQFNKALKYKTMCGFFFQIEVQFSMKNASLPPIALAKIFFYCKQ